MRTGTFLGACLLAAATGAAAAPFAYQTDDQQRLIVIDLATGSIGSRIQLASPAPLGVAIKPSGDRVYVTDTSANTVTVVDTVSNTIAATIPVCRAPFPPAVNPSGTELVVPCGGTESAPNTEVDVINLSTNTVSARLTAGSVPASAVWNPSGTRFYVANLGSGTVSVFDATNNAVVQTLNVPGAFAMAFNQGGTRLYITRDVSTTVSSNTTHSIAVIDPNTGSTLATIPVADNILWLSINPAGTRLYAAILNTDTVVVIDTTSNTVLTTFSTGVGSGPGVAVVGPDGTRLYVLLASGTSSDIAVYDANTLARLNTIHYATNAGLIGNFVSAGPASTAANTPGALSGQWWNHNESGWGVHFTQRGNTIFAAWYTYDALGNPKWYVTTCTNTPSGCTGSVLQVTASRFFGVQFSPSTVLSNGVGFVTFVFNGNDAGTMTYTVNGVSRSVAIERQPLQASGTAPAVNYTDLWWNSPANSESGWGLAITHQFSTMFLAWYVYNDSGQPMWYVATITNATSSGGTGQLFRTTGPAFSTSFNPNAVVPIPAGTITVNFTDPNNGTINYTVTGEGSGSKTITRQIF